jgi:tetratricopeptide (TPR) repeat protein
MVLFFENDVEGALKVGERAVAINPNDTELIGEYGVRLAISGNWKRGGEFLAKALDRNLAPLGYLETTLALCLYMQRDYEGAAIWIRRAHIQPNPLYHFIAATIYGQVGDVAAAGRERAWIEANAPDLLRNLRQEFAMRNMKPQDRAHFVEGLRKAGFSIPDV